MVRRPRTAPRNENETKRGVPGGTQQLDVDAGQFAEDEDEGSVAALEALEQGASILSGERSRRGGGASGGGAGAPAVEGLFSDDELRALEESHADGITAVQIVDIFANRGVRFSEATFRKYVQQGLLPRSRRVGRKGKHRGSLGVYPAKTVRRINAIKRLMADGYTIEEIQEQFLRYTDVLETLDEGIAEVFAGFEQEVVGPRFRGPARRDLERELAEARRMADELLRRIDDIARRIAAPERGRYRSTGAAGSAEDLL